MLFDLDKYPRNFTLLDLTCLRWCYVDDRIDLGEAERILVSLRPKDNFISGCPDLSTEAYMYAKCVHLPPSNKNERCHSASLPGGSGPN